VADALNFVMNLVDRASGPGGRIYRSLDRIDKAAGRVDRTSRSMAVVLHRSVGMAQPQAQRLAATLDRVRNAAAGVGAGAAGVMRLAHALGITSVNGRTVLSVLSGIRRTLFNLPNLLAAGAAAYSGKMVLDAVRFKQDTLTAFEVMAGGRRQGEAIFQDAVKFAADTPFETDQVVDTYKKLLAFQFKPVEVPIIMKAVGDVAALKGFSQETIDRLTMTLGQIRAKGKTQGEELMQLAEAGIPLAKIYDVIGKRLGKTREETQKLISAGKVSSDLGIVAVLQTIEQTMSGGKLGGGMARFSRNLTGLFSTLSSRPSEMFMDLDTSPGIKSLTTFMDLLVKATDTGSESGGRLKVALQSAFGDIFEAIFGPMTSGPDPAKRIRDMVDRVAVTIVRFSVWWKATIPGVIENARAFGSGMMVAFNMLGVAWNIVKPIFSLIGNLLGGLFGDGNTGAAGVIGFAVGLAGIGAIVNMILGPILRMGSILLTVGRVLWSVTSFAGRLAFSLIRLGATWLIGLGPIGWVIIAVLAIGAALVLAYNKVGWFRDGVNAAWDWIKAKALGFMDYLRTLPAEWSAIGSMMVQGLVDGIYGMGEALASAGTWLYDNTVGRTKAALGIQSPSRVFAWMGSMMTAGMAQGVMAGAPRVAAAVGALGATATLAMGTPALAMPEIPGASPAVPSVAAPAGAAPAGGGAPQITVPITVHVGGGGGGASATEQGQAIAQEVKAAATEGLLEALEMVAAEGGFGG
jgi:tape measure domain-containing protein